MTVDVDVEDKARSLVEASAVEEFVYRVEELGIEAVQLQHALDRGKDACIIVQDKDPFALDHGEVASQ